MNKQYPNIPISKFPIAVFIIAVSVLLFYHVSFAQTPINSDTAFGGATGQTVETLSGEAGLGTTDFRLGVARVINIALGFLGIIAVALIIYAGFLWLTAAGKEENIANYVEIAGKFIKPSGYLIIATFSVNGPKKCSGLDIMQYSDDSIKKTFQKDFSHIRSFEEIHTTPFNTKQNFLFNVFKRNL